MDKNNTKIKSLINTLPILLILIISISLRILNLGYSDYQGDEIKAFFDPGPDETVSEFLLDQRKGPGQFFVTYLISLVNNDYSNEFVSRLPFAIAGILSVFYFYKLLEKEFNSKVAFYASFFFATNGFLVALTRIVQYQSFVILFMILSTYVFSRLIYLDKRHAKTLILGFLFWSLSFLFHYDAVFILPINIYFIYRWLNSTKENKDLYKSNVKLLFATGIIGAIPALIFYIPYIFNIATSTIEYWEGRITGDVSNKISSSRYLFSVYQPIYVIHFYTLLFGAGFLPLVFKKYKLDINLKKYFFVILWFLFPFLFLEGVVYIPGTHIYTYLIPMFVFLGVGILFIEKVLYSLKSYILPGLLIFAGLTTLFSFIYLQSYYIYVDNNKEYPWESEQFFIWEFHQPTPIYHLSMFGFPYYRNWEEIGNLVNTIETTGYYSTNERSSISRHYVDLDKDTDKAGYYIHVLNPQSFTNELINKKANYWAERYAPVFVFSRFGKDIVRVYDMEPGSLEEIIEKGF